jgi:hypothetical protein
MNLPQVARPAEKLSTRDADITPLQAIWRASLRSTCNVLRFDLRMRIGTVFTLLIQLGLAIWALSRLIPMFAQWKALDSVALNAHLWLICLSAWGIIVLFAVLNTLFYGLGSDEALLLLIQPVAPALRLRALYSQVLWHGVGRWLLCEATLLSIALSLAFGWGALPWLLLLVLGALSVAWLSMLATLLVARYVLPHPLRALLYGLVCVVGGVLLALLARSLHLWVGVESARLSTMVSSIIAVPLTCALVASALLGCLLLAWFPLARRFGLLYLAALQQQQGRDSSVRALVLPGLGTILALLAHWRTPTGALLSKGLLQQSRHVFTWLRLLMLVVLLTLFSLLHPWLAALPLNATLQVACYAAFVAFMALLEYAPYAVGSEGARLALYLTAPFDPARFLRARLISYLVPDLLIGWLSALILGAWIGLNLFSLLLALALLSLILAGFVALTVLGSVLDADLTQVAEDSMQILLLEEMPMTPRRLQLLGVTILHFGMMLLLCWKLPMPGAFLVLVGLDTLLLVGGERVGRKSLARLLF